MADLIDRDKLIDFIMESDPDWCVKPIRPIFDFIYGMPSVDAVKVIRCEQCMHYNSIDFHCYYHGSMCFKPNDYCPYGRVRDDG